MGDLTCDPAQHATYGICEQCEPGTVDQRDPLCLERWPHARDGAYDPRCCRFPKSCSAGPEPG